MNVSLKRGSLLSLLFALLIILALPGSAGCGVVSKDFGWSDPKWSPNGKMIAALKSRAHGYINDLYVMNADGSGKTRLVKDIKTHGCWLQDSSGLVYLAPYEERKLMMINADGRNQRVIAEIPNSIDEFVLSPDGLKIAFADNPHLYVINVDGTNLKEIADDYGCYLTWSPDGKKIFYDFKYPIYMIDLETGKKKKITEKGNLLGCSPDGERLAMCSTITATNRWGKSSYKLYLIDIANGKKTEICNDYHGNFSWSPDGEKFLYTTADETVFVIDANTGAKTEIAKSPVPVFWFPDSERVLFSLKGIISKDPAFGVYKYEGGFFVINADGSGEKMITQNGSTYRASLSQDGKKIVFALSEKGRFDIWVINIDGSGLKKITP